jgi:outer membrane protein assembly factor BamB
MITANYIALGVGSETARVHKVVVLDIKEGSELWSSEIISRVSCITTFGSSLFVGTWSSKVYAFNILTGELNWEFKAGNSIYDIAVNENLFVGSWDGAIYVLDTRGGRVLKKFLPQFRPIYIIPLEENRLLLGGENLSCINWKTGEIIWINRLKIYMDCLTISERVIIGSWNKYVHCVDSITGDEYWKFKTDDIVYSITSFDGKICFGTLGGVAFLLESFPLSVLWEKHTKQSIYSVDVKRKRILVGLESKAICYELMEGKEQFEDKKNWDINTKRNVSLNCFIEDNSVIIADKVYFISNSGELIWSTSFEEPIYNVAFI